MHSRIALWMTLAAVVSVAGVFLFSAPAMESDPGLPASHWQHPLPAQGEAPKQWPQLERDLSPQACAQCHEDQHRDWSQSLHAHAFSPGLAGQFPGIGVEESNSCLNCHAPLAEQKLVTGADISESLKLLDQKPSLERLPLRHAGVSCASCHVRGWKRFGPPRRDSDEFGWIKGPAHGGFYATRDFEKSQLCASCHQFPQSAAINGKPLENTVSEWKMSRFAKEGVNCQGCHMPDRRHEFRGIHDPDMTRKGLTISLHQKKDTGELRMQSTWIGHAFPTYVTPKVVVFAKALDGRGHELEWWHWDIMREVDSEGGWHEIRDTRLLPGELRTFQVGPVPVGTQKLVFRVHVMPDEFYKGVYRGLLATKQTPQAARQIQTALAQANANDYVLYEGELKFP